LEVLVSQTTKAYVIILLMFSPVLPGALGSGRQIDPKVALVHAGVRNLIICWPFALWVSGRLCLPVVFAVKPGRGRRQLGVFLPPCLPGVANNGCCLVGVARDMAGPARACDDLKTRQINNQQPEPASFQRESAGGHPTKTTHFSQNG